MSNISKKSVSIIGMIVGAIIIIIGFLLQNTSLYSIGEFITFGADFYTEMYEVTIEVGEAINKAINDLICAVSWLIISLGAIDICFFAYKFAKASEASNSNTEETSAEEIEKQKAAKEVQAAKSEAKDEQLSKSDIEDAASKYLKRRVSISDITCTLIYVIPKSTGTPKEMHLDMSVGDKEFTSLDLFFDQQRKSYFFKGRQLALDGAWRSEEEIFGFNVSKFREFNTEVDEDE